MELNVLNFQISVYLLNIILCLILILSVVLVFSKNLVQNTILLSVMNLLFGLSYLMLDAPDVAMTEVALGACLSTCIILAFLSKLPKEVKVEKQGDFKIFPLFIYFLFACVVIYCGDLPPEYGSVEAISHSKSNKYYLENTHKEIGIESVVAAVLASYRGFDTLGETSVIFLAAISILFIFAIKYKKVDDEKS